MKLTAPRSSRSPMRSRSRTKKYRQRVRFTSYMLEVKRLPCAAVNLPGHTCSGVIEADHAGPRGLGQKAHDATVIPLCSQGHRERTDFSGPFRTWNQERMRSWLIGRVLQVQRYLQFTCGIPLPEMSKPEFAEFTRWLNLRVADDIADRDIKPPNVRHAEDIREVGNVDVRFPEGDH